MKRVFIFHLGFLFCILFGPGAAAAQNPAHQKIQQAVEQREYQTAVSELEALRQTDKDAFELNNYDYLLARMAEKTGDYAAAMTNYQAVANRDSVLRQYALWHLAQLARSSGNLLLERMYLQQIQIFAPASLLAEAIGNRLARSHFESKDYAAAIRLLSGQQSAINKQLPEKSTNNKTPTANHRLMRENLNLLAQAYLQTNQREPARAAFTALTNDLPNPAQPDDFALAGAKGLDLLDGGAENFGRTAPALPDFEHLRRAQIYQFNRDFPDARLHYRAIIENHPQSGNTPDAIYQTGRGYAQIGEFVEAINWFERVQEQFPEHPIAKDALSQAASAYARVNKPKEAITRYQKFIEKYPDAENLERAYLNIIDVLRDGGGNADALQWTAKTQAAFQGELPEALALFAQARIRIVQNDWPNALADLDKLLGFPDLGGTRAPGGTNRVEIVFLKGFALENLQRFPEAIEIYLSIPDGRGEYYGWRATERLKLLASNEATGAFVAQKIGELSKNIEQRNAEAQRQAAQSVLRLSDVPALRARMLEIIKKTYASLPAYQKIPNFKLLELGRKEVLSKKRDVLAPNLHKTLADELLFLGLYDEAAPELESSRRSVFGDQPIVTDGEENQKAKLPKPQSDFEYTLAVFYKRGEMAHRAAAFLEPLWRSIPAEYEIELLPRQQIEMLYPAPYADALLRYAPERDVDPRFILAIMRQESRFRADVKSYAAARGLMQFISTTAERIADDLDRENFQQDELYYPPTAILFGSQYLANLFEIFPNQPAAVAASYNGGEDNVKRWMNRSRSDLPDRYVPEIVFSQSKDYVYKVMANYRIYQMIYDENLKTR